MASTTGRFSREDRLRRAREFQQVTRYGRRAAGRAYVMFTARGAEGGGPRLGLTVSRKVGNAVVRNRVKRRIREWFRRERDCFGGAWDVVVIARRDAVGLDCEASAQVLSGLVRQGVGR